MANEITPSIRRTAGCLSVTQGLLQSGYSVQFRAHGGSMHPTIRDGELVTVAPVRPRSLRRGDVVLYQTARGVIAHRLVRVDDMAGRTQYVCRGDSVATEDTPIETGAILGRVVTIERGGRSQALHRPGLQWAVARLRAALRHRIAQCPALASLLIPIRLPRLAERPGSV